MTRDQTESEKVNQAWAAEIQRRLKLLESGQMKTVETRKVLAKLAAKIKK